MAKRNEQDIKFRLKETKTRWDYLSTLKPPEDLSIETGNIWRMENLPEGTPDYDFISKLFLSTINGIPQNNIASARKSKKPKGAYFGMNPPPAYNPPPFVGMPAPVGGMFGGPVGGPVLGGPVLGGGA